MSLGMTVGIVVGLVAGFAFVIFSHGSVVELPPVIAIIFGFIGAFVGHAIGEDMKARKRKKG